MKQIFLSLLAVSMISLLSCGDNGSKPPKKENAHNYEFAFQNPDKTIDERIADLVARLTLEEKISQMMYDAPAIERLNIPAYNWWNEALHGVGRSGISTVFPQAIAMAAMFDEDMMYKISTAISDEARANYNAAIKLGNRGQYGGLTFWTPNINIFRDPRWGRGQETYGEDPYLTAQLGVAFVKGLQGNNPNYLKTAACGKHFAVHSGPEGLRHEFNAVTTNKDLYETYLPAFEALVKKGHVESIMCAYNRTNGDPCCGSNTLLQEILRNEWQFKGHIVSDCWALRDFHEGHKVTSTPVESAALALKSGVNLNCGSIYNPYLVEAVQQGLVSEDLVNERLTTLLRTRFKLGLFDPEGLNPYNDITLDSVAIEKHKSLSREAADKSIVLLSNKNNVLPLSKKNKYLFITGPNANNTEVLMGNYYGVSKSMVTILEGIAGKIAPGAFLQYKQGFLLDRDNINPIDWASSEAKVADATIVVMGISPLLEGEEGEAIASPTKGDRFDYNIPENQLKFLRKMREGNQKPIIAVITTGSPVNLKEVSELADAVVLAFYPGQEGGNAVADVIFGDVNPSGRLPITFPMSIDQLPPFEDYSMVGRTYRYMTKTPMYPFGFGLSFTKFEYANPIVSKTSFSKGDSIEVSVDVSNIGEINGEEVVQLYLSQKNVSFRVPQFALKGFKRVNLAAKDKATVTFRLKADEFVQINEQGIKELVPGEMQIIFAGASPYDRSIEMGSSKPVKTSIIIQ